jgi:hypothetical protein
VLHLGLTLVNQAVSKALYRLGKKVGDLKASNSLAQIKEYITSSVRTKLADREIATVDWKTNEGTQVAEAVLKETIEVFGVMG